MHGVDNIVRRQIVCKATHPDEDGPYGHIFATILGRMRAHDGPGQRSPGPAHPPPGWNAGTSE